MPNESRTPEGPFGDVAVNEIKLDKGGTIQIDPHSFPKSQARWKGVIFLERAVIVQVLPQNALCRKSDLALSFRVAV